jgi:hypothetical protein
LFYWRNNGNPPHKNKENKSTYDEVCCLLIPDFKRLTEKTQDSYLTPHFKEEKEKKVLTFTLEKTASDYKFITLDILMANFVNILFHNNEYYFKFQAKYNEDHLLLYSRLFLYIRLTVHHQGNANITGFPARLRSLVFEKSTNFLKTRITYLENVVNNPIPTLIEIDSELKPAKKKEGSKNNRNDND